jgi:hypothetical protein
MFRHYVIPTTVSLGVIAGVLCYRGWSAQPEPRSALVRELVGATEETRRAWMEMEDQQQRRDEFMRFEGRLIDALEHAEIALRDAVERSFYYCLQNYPEHLLNVNNATGGAHIKAKLALNILRALEARTELRGGDPAVVARVECELAALPYDQRDAVANVTSQ